ncbi:glutaminase A [Rothia halotolerans]|uniref:glutaminase A n=1 Tax=Rothia halotolerans TaxID=405770 RepID=UPI00101E0914|nr:glutaminase A [Rothia halotolerans]
MESPIRQYLANVHRSLSVLDEGQPSHSTPVLSEGNPDSFGIAIATVDGHVYEVGETAEEFTVQSISKALSYGIALQDHGFEYVDERIDVEPSGDAFNEISLQTNGRPDNPLINAGAIATTALIDPRDEGRAPRILEAYGRYAGRELEVNRASHEQESRYGDRNRAMGYLMKSFGIIEGDVEQALDDYFFQCSISVTTRDLAIMSATLANNGVNPVTGEQVAPPEVNARVLSVMSTCGMYDDSGHWMTEVGIPAKSGIGGGIIAVLSGEMGLAVYSPPLDEHGNSVRGVEACRRLSDDLQLHFAHATAAAQATVRGVYPISESPSQVRRNQEAQDVLDEYAARAVVVELQGDLMFAAVDSAVRAIIDAAEEDVVTVIVDGRRVGKVLDASGELFRNLRESFAAEGRELAVVDPESLLPLPEGIRTFNTKDSAAAWAEDLIIERYGSEDTRPERVGLLDSPLAAHISAEDRQRLGGLLERRSAREGEEILAPGEGFAGIHMIISGRVRQTLPVRMDEAGDRPSGDAEREEITVGELSPGMTFGEGCLGFEDRQVLRVTALDDVEYFLLPADALERLDREDPAFGLLLWQAIAREGYRQVGQQLREIGLRTSQMG